MRKADPCDRHLVPGTAQDCYGSAHVLSMCGLLACMTGLPPFVDPHSAFAVTILLRKVRGAGAWAPQRVRCSIELLRALEVRYGGCQGEASYMLAHQHIYVAFGGGSGIRSGARHEIEASQE